MPIYKIDINRIIQEPEARAMINRAKGLRNRALIAFFYLTGARPIEAQELRGENITINNTHVTMKVWTAKKGKGKGFDPDTRTLEVTRDAPFAQVFIDYAENKHGRDLLFNISTRQIRRIVHNASKEHKDGLITVCPYSFRHSRMTKLCNEGATLTELMYWKGSKEAKSVSSYIANKPIGRELVIT